jgi:hypothetical protein
MLHYPPVITTVCKYCKAPLVLQRQGSGRSLEGRLDYCYTTDHRCPEGERAVKTKEADTRWKSFCAARVSDVADREFHSKQPQAKRRRRVTAA